MIQKEKALALLGELERHTDRHHVDIVDVEIVGASRAPVICVRIDNPFGSEQYHPITLDEVSSHTTWISEIVETFDPFEGAYHLEVSSPGVDRPLRKREDFLRFEGQRCEIVTNVAEGRRKWTGTIQHVNPDESVCLIVDGSEVIIALSDIKKATLKAELSFKPAQSKGK